MLDHRDLVRDRAVEARPAHGPRSAHGVAERVGRDLAVEVARVEAVMPVGRLDHRDRRVLGRRHGERAGEDAEEAGHPAQSSHEQPRRGPPRARRRPRRGAPDARAGPARGARRDRARSASAAPTSTTTSTAASATRVVDARRTCSATRAPAASSRSGERRHARTPSATASTLEPGLPCGRCRECRSGALQPLPRRRSSSARRRPTAPSPATSRMHEDFAHALPGRAQRRGRRADGAAVGRAVGVREGRRHAPATAC